MVGSDGSFLIAGVKRDTGCISEAVDVKVSGGRPDIAKLSIVVRVLYAFTVDCHIGRWLDVDSQGSQFATPDATGIQAM